GGASLVQMSAPISEYSIYILHANSGRTFTALENIYLGWPPAGGNKRRKKGICIIMSQVAVFARVVFLLHLSHADSLMFVLLGLDSLPSCIPRQSAITCPLWFTGPILSQLLNRVHHGHRPQRL